MRPCFLLLGLSACSAAPEAPVEIAFCGAHERPNVVVIFADDLGFGDLSCQGQTAWTTPHLDALADQGTRFTRFYVSQPVCSASRASLLTGCYANRLSFSGALGPGNRRGLHPEETTLGEVFQRQGYATAALGKWHLGHHSAYLPTRHGFDAWYGLPYSNDMWRFHPESPGAWAPLPLMMGDEVLDLDPDQTTLTRSLTERAVEFIEDQAGEGRPFFLYLAHPMPHVPIEASLPFAGEGPIPYADTVREIDWSVGQVMEALERLEIADDTLVLFTSDNGPWLSYGNHAGTTGGLREGKGTTFEGGVRVPAILRYPRSVPAGRVCDVPWMTIDVLPTLVELLGAPAPPLPIDGRSALSLWQGDESQGSPSETYGFWYHQGDLEAVMSGRWKLHLEHRYRSLTGGASGTGDAPAKYDYGVLQAQALYDLDTDPAESTDVSAEHPDVLQRLLEEAAALRTRLGDRLTETRGEEVRPLGPPVPPGP